jgi:hypothetical protein
MRELSGAAMFFRRSGLLRLLSRAWNIKEHIASLRHVNGAPPINFRKPKGTLLILAHLASDYAKGVLSGPMPSTILQLS